MNFSQNTRNRNMALGLAALVVALILIALLWRGKNSSPELVAAGFQNLDEATSYHVRAEISANLPIRLGNRERPFNQVVVRVDGDVLENSNGTPELTGRLFGETRGRGAVLFTDGDIRILSDKTLFRLDNLPLLLNPSGSLIEKWTESPAGLLQTRNGATLRDVLAQISTSFRADGSEKIGDTTYARFRTELTPEIEDSLVKAAQLSASGNHGWHIIARLLNANNIQTLDVFVDTDTKQVRRIRANFQTPKAKRNSAVLVIDFTEYNKTVTIDRPERQLTVKPEVFSKLFRTGEISAQP